MAVLAALTTLTLVLPNATTTTPGPGFSTAQLIFAGTVSLVLYAAYVFVQTVRHRDFFQEAHAPPPDASTAWMSAGLLVLALVAVVGLAKTLTPALETAIDLANAPKSVVVAQLIRTIIIETSFEAAHA